MPVFHISLECTTPTAHTDGTFRTLVAVTDAELRGGAHLREAARRALIIGFGGPHRVVASRRLDAVSPEPSVGLSIPDGQLPVPSMGDRLELLLPLATAADDNLAAPDALHPPMAARRQQSRRHARVRGTNNAR